MGRNRDAGVRRHIGKKPYGEYSYWLESCGDDLTPRPGLKGSLTVDVAIVGAGFSGLWTAYYLLQTNPSLRVVILEQAIAGFGASGRNGGWCTAEFSRSITSLVKRYGTDATRLLQQAMFDSVDEVGRVIQVENIEAHFAKGGMIEVARGQWGIPALETMIREFEMVGLENRVQYLDRDQLSSRIQIAEAEAGVFAKDCAVLHPGRLVRQLARVVENLGATIMENTAVLEVIGGKFPRLITGHGDVTTKVAVVMATEAYLTALKPWHRAVVPVYSLITLTEPLSHEVWETIGWTNREAIASTRMTIDYLQRTHDGRILFGGRGAPYHWNSSLRDEYDHHRATHKVLQEMVKQWFPVLKDTRFTHVWGGALGVTRDFMPNIRFDLRTRIATAFGYTGQGVATSNLAGRILNELISETPGNLTHLPMAQHHSRLWEPEPLRWAGIRYTQWALGRIDQQSQRLQKSPSGSSLAERLNVH
ncbi:MAG: FAD-dependent oxidoreductase [Sulfobacillus benefaciens]|uniref:FAD-dependent oxidoreductase n=1 Tax=Sulfobacillus benefaciens TaxID=453960 RepID=A0A2T2XFU5_9FIRM|nr:MAG: FAD-dependent oxidoreductase [Sulfobacillus benefaciens]